MEFKAFVSEIETDSMKLLGDFQISENLKYHLENNLSLCNNIFRVGSDSYFDLIKEIKSLYYENKVALNDDDFGLLETDLCEIFENGDELIYLDLPVLIGEAEHKGKKVKLNNPSRTPGGPKKFKVYVKGKNGKIKIVRFGDPNLKIKNMNPSRSKSFRARHKCSEKKDRTTPGYWSCNIARYAKMVGLSSSNPW